jgi:curved DNA-binding protein CbpA
MHSSPGGSGEEERIPRIAPGWDPNSCTLTPAEGFLFSRIDGRTSWTALRQIGGISPEQVDRTLERWAKEGMIVVGAGPAAADRSAARGARPSPAARGSTDRSSGAKPAAARGTAATDSAAMDAASVDAGLDLSVELQRRILAFDRSLDRSYHELLGVERSADDKEIKRAYFRLSKEYHPDRYFRRNIGGYALRLDRIFKRISEAYELLSDPTTRQEIERAMRDAPPAEGAYAGAGGSEPIGPEQRRRRAPEVPARIRHLQRLRARFKVPEKAVAERRFKARQFFGAARAAAHEKRWIEAAASMRLAIAFDPLNPDYKRGFADIQADVHRARAERLIEEADGAGARGDALRLLEEALNYRPLDVAVNRRAAELCLELDQLDRAREYAETLCEVEPEVATHHVLLARALRRQGVKERARKALDRAAALDPKHPDVIDEQKQQRPRGRR